MKNNSYKKISLLVASLALSQQVCAEQEVIRHKPTHLVIRPDAAVKTGHASAQKVTATRKIEQPAVQSSKTVQVAKVSQPAVAKKTVAAVQAKPAVTKQAVQKTAAAKVVAPAPIKKAVASAPVKKPVVVAQAKPITQPVAVQVVQMPVAVDVQQDVLKKDDAVFADYWDYLTDPEKNAKSYDVATNVQAATDAAHTQDMTQAVDSALQYFENKPQPARVGERRIPSVEVQTVPVAPTPTYTQPLNIHHAAFDEPEHAYEVVYEDEGSKDFCGSYEPECPEPTCCDGDGRTPLSQYNAEWGDQRLDLGRRYAYLGVDGLECKRWIMPLSFHASFTDKAFNASGNRTSLATALFGEKLTLQDIYLLARISNTVRTTLDYLNGAGAVVPVNVGFISRSPDVTPDNPIVLGNIGTFGNAQEDQYLYLLAPMEFNFSAEQQQFRANLLSLIYRYPLDCCEKYTLFFGFNVPFVSKRHLLDYQLVKGELFRHNGQREVSVNENSLAQFFKDYMSVDDFLQRAVFAQKGIVFDNKQRKTGLGDLELFFALDIALGNKCDDAWYAGHLQAGMYVDVPTASKPKGNKLWEIELGNSGATVVRPFVEFQFRRCKTWFNPVINLSGNITTTSTVALRVPRSITSVGGAAGIAVPTLVKDVPGLLTPPIVTRAGDPEVDYPSNYFLAPGYPGSTVDSTVALFADVATNTRRKIGNSFVAAIGNYFYRALSCCSRLGVFYEYEHKSCDKITPCANGSTFVTTAVTNNTNRTAHTMMWHLTHKWRDCFEFSIGSRHIVAGKNVPKTHEGYVALVLAF